MFILVAILDSGPLGPLMNFGRRDSMILQDGSTLLKQCCHLSGSDWRENMLSKDSTEATHTGSLLLPFSMRTMFSLRTLSSNFTVFSPAVSAFMDMDAFLKTGTVL